ncbi:MAG: sulfatase [Balneolaceae bacterium]
MKRKDFIRTIGAGAVALPFVSGLSSRGSSKGRQGKPNVLFISIDDLNDWVGCMDAKTGIRTPNIDRLAGQGTLFTRAYCSAPSCTPSRTSLMTGLRPSSCGVYDNVGYYWRENSYLEDAKTLPRHFRENGYHTMGGGKLFHGLSWISDSYGRNQNDPDAWDDYYPSVDQPMPDHVFPEGTRKEGSAFVWDRVTQGPEGDAGPFYPFDWGPLDVPESEMSDYKVASWAASELEKEHDKPFFLGAGIFLPHMPWFVPQKYFDMYPIDEIHVPLAPEDDLDNLPPAGRQMGSGRRGWHNWVVRNGHWKSAVQAYKASITFIDEQIGRMLDALESGPNADNTIIILWSDHGFHLGEKQTWEKFTLWEEAGRVPFIIKAPGVTSPGSRCGVPVSLLDIYPTLNHLCGLPDKENLEGEDLVSLLREPGTDRDRGVVTTFGYRNHSIRTRRWRYIQYANGEEELYDHDHDSGEFQNLAGAEEYQSIKDDLAVWLPEVNVEPFRV